MKINKLTFKLLMNPYDAAIDAALTEIMEANPTNVKVDSYYITIKLKGSKIELWNANKWHSWLCRAKLIKDNGDAVALWNDRRPSRSMMLKFDKWLASHQTAIIKDALNED